MGEHVREFRQASVVLLERLHREVRRGSDVGGTLRAGGFTLALLQLEHLIRAAVRLAAAEIGQGAQALFVRARPRITAGDYGVEDAGAGALATTLQAHSRAFVADPGLRLLLTDLKSGRSIVRDAIGVRNDLFHGRTVPDGHAERVLADLAGLLEQVVAAHEA